MSMTRVGNVAEWCTLILHFSFFLLKRQDITVGVSFFGNSLLPHKVCLLCNLISTHTYQSWLRTYFQCIQKVVLYSLC